MIYTIIKQNVKNKFWRKTIVFKNGAKINLISEKEDFSKSEKDFLRKFFPDLKVYSAFN